MAKFDKCKSQKLHLLPYFTSEPLPHPLPPPFPHPLHLPPSSFPHPYTPFLPLPSLPSTPPPSFRGELTLDPKMCKEVFQNDQMVLSL